MRIISVFDTTICEYNLGNEIIMDSVQLELDDMFKTKFQYNIPYMQINKNIKSNLNQSDYVFFGGTNCLSSYMNTYKQWDINLLKTLYVKNIIMMGVGWWQYQGKPNEYTKLVLRRALSQKYYHSVRDSYTEYKLKNIGFKVINTGCPTLWRITDKKINQLLNLEKKENVIMTFTDYNKDFEKDKEIFEICNCNYKKIYIWLQGVGDYSYINYLIKNNNKVKLIPPNLENFNNILSRGDMDYIGTRLHAGIRALQKGIRAFFIAIDNRTVEMGNDIGLIYFKREELYKLKRILEKPYNINLKINYKAISKWKSQFK